MLCAHTQLYKHFKPNKSVEKRERKKKKVKMEKRV